MKGFMGKRWHRIPVGILTAMLTVCLLAGGALAAYGFFTADLEVNVEEALVVAIWPDWDNLEPYGSVDDVEILLGGTEEEPVITITTIPGYAGAGFVAGEEIVIPVNFRNAGDGELTLSATASGGGGSLVLGCSFEENLGPATSTESGQYLCRGYEAVQTFAGLNGWTGTIAGNGGKSGSAVVGAQVLFIKISAPGDAVPGDYTYTITLERS